MSIKSKKFEIIKLAVIGVFLLSIISLRSGCHCHSNKREEKPKEEEKLANTPKENNSNKKTVLGSNDNGGYFKPIRNANIYTKPDISSTSHYYLNEGVEFFVDDLNRYKYFYEYKDDEVTGYILKDDLRRNK